MALEANIVIAYDSTYANSLLEVGYSRYTALDARYPLGASAGNAGGATGGAANHTHTETGHTHIQNSHTHTFTGGAANGTITVTVGITTYPSGTHTHASKSSNATTATNQSTTVTFNTTSNDPPYYEVIYLQSDGSANIPNNGMGWLNSVSVPTNFTQVNTDKFWKGAAALGNAGGTGGSSDSHTHTETATHNHTQDAHSHSALASNGVTGNINANPAGGAGQANRGHTHLVSLDSGTATNSAASVTLQNADGQPPYRKLLGIKNTSGGSVVTPDHFVALWPNSLASIPATWTLCDGGTSTQDMRDKFVKNANLTSELGNTGGADQHTHIADAHTHTQVAHNHTSTAGNGTEVSPDITSLDVVAALGNHTHVWTIGSTTAVNQNTTITINNNTSKNNYPLFLTMAFIEKNAGAVATVRMLASAGAGI